MKSSALTFGFVFAALLSIGCGRLYRAVPVADRMKAHGDNWELEVQTEAPPGIPQKAICALQLLEQVRADPKFAAALSGRTYNFKNDSDDAVATPAGVLACAMKKVSIPWRLRHCHWPDVLNREYGANKHDDGFYIRTYDCRAVEFTVGELAAHLLHEHMHTCGYQDVGGDNGTGLATYVVGGVVETLIGKVNDCPPGTGSANADVASANVPEAAAPVTP